MLVCLVELGCDRNVRNPPTSGLGDYSLDGGTCGCTPRVCISMINA